MLSRAGPNLVKSRCPASVTETARVVRATRRTPSRASRACIA